MWTARSWAALRWKPAVLLISLRTRYKRVEFMGFIIGLLTLIMVLDCLLLVLLVLIQLPKKEAGAGLAFGGGYSDALFGAGSGNVMTKITKYAAGIFFAL